MSFKINNPFTNNDERSGSQFESYMHQSWRDERASFNKDLDERMGEIKKLEENFVKRRGTSKYYETMERRRQGDQPVFTNSKEKKYPYLMSVYNLKQTQGGGLNLPWQCHPDPTHPRNDDVASCRRWHEDNFTKQLSLAGTPRGLLKDMEHDARLSSEIMEEALAMDYTEENYVKNLTGLISRLQDEKGGFKLGGANIKNNRKNVAWQTKQQILKMIEDHEVAVEAQDVADTNRITSWEFDQIKNRVDELGNFEL